MLKNNIRMCDVCGEEIPADIKYRKVVLKSEIANLFLVNSQRFKKRKKGSTQKI